MKPGRLSSLVFAAAVCSQALVQCAAAQQEAAPPAQDQKPQTPPVEPGESPEPKPGQKADQAADPAARPEAPPDEAPPDEAKPAGEPDQSLLDPEDGEKPIKIERPPEPPPPPQPSRTAGPDEIAPTEDDGQPYLVARIVLEYSAAHPENPELGTLLNLQVGLTPVPEGYVAPRPGAPVVLRRISELGLAGAEGKPVFLYGSALRAIGQRVVRELNKRGLIVVFVEPNPEDIDALSDSQDDLRLHPETDPMRLIIRLGAVKELRTVAAGDRKIKGERINNPLHAYVKAGSPLQGPPAAAPAPGRPARSPEEQPEEQPAEPAEAPEAQRGSLIRRDQLDDYVARLNRHPGRRVDVAIAPADADSPGEVLVDYLVNENNPWTIYAQVSNTGTRNTDLWRERFGFSNTQLTGNDDILRLDFITAGFQDTSALIASYEFPIGSDALRGRVYGSLSEFTASDVGLGGENFTGTGWNIGGEGIWNLYQKHDLFVDGVAGFRAQRVCVENEVLEVAGNATFYIPYVGVRASRETEASSSYGALTLESTIGNPSQEQVDNMGRAEPDKNWTVLQYEAGTSFFLEPIFFPDARRPQDGATLAHEMAISLHGQWAFDNRLIPNAEDTAGGLSTVRGYPESVVAGDSTIIGTLEYRFHLARAMGVEPDPTATPLFGQPFRYRPQQAYGQADWDLILKTFLDAGRVVNSDRLEFETDETLVGTGLGVELQIMRNFSARVDWGIALTQVSGGEEVSAGSNRFHISLTLLY